MAGNESGRFQVAQGTSLRLVGNSFSRLHWMSLCGTRYECTSFFNNVFVIKLIDGRNLVLLPLDSSWCLHQLNWSAPFHRTFEGKQGDDENMFWIQTCGYLCVLPNVIERDIRVQLSETPLDCVVESEFWHLWISSVLLLRHCQPSVFPYAWFLCNTDIPVSNWQSTQGDIVLRIGGNFSVTN